MLYIYPDETRLFGVRETPPEARAKPYDPEHVTE